MIEDNILPFNTTLKNPSGRPYLRMLFYEIAIPSNSPVVSYTLKDQDHTVEITDPETQKTYTRTFPSLYRLYMEMEDVTEFDFANKYLSGFKHWKLLTECSWFKSYVTRWREELHLKISSRAIRNLIEDSQNEKSQTKTSSAKYLLEKGWMKKETVKTTKVTEPKKTARQVADDKFQEIIDHDYKRIIG